MKKTQLTALFLLSAMLASCGASDTPEDTTAEADTTSAAPVSDELLPDLPDKKYDGETITFFIRNDENGIADMYVEEADGDIMNDAIFERNSKVSEQFGVQFDVVISANPYGHDAVNTILAGDDSYDILVPHGRNTFTYAQQGLLLDWNTDLPYVDLDKPWWNQDARKQFSFCDNLYVMIGDISYMNLGMTNCMLFNKAMFDEYALDYPYQTVIDGEWTFDKFTTLAASAVRDLNGDTKINPADDQMGYITGPWIGPIQVLYTAEQRICEKDENDEMYLTLNTERTVEVFEKYFSFCSTDGMFINTTNEVKTNDVFSEGRAMFMDMNIMSTMNLRDMEDDFGIIPWPKFDETVEKYYTNVDAGCNLLGVPITAKDPECISVILEALCYEGYKNVVPTYYDVVLQTKYTRDEESPAMIDLIREGRVFDIGYYYSNVMFCYELNSIGYHLSKQEDPNFSTFYAKYESAALADIEEINTAYREMKQ
ncbi:MAG: extracellular solute-binding protein [Clostridia bacterium]|nr:extracellular solute-binding protein [Clostridia bacterium]